MPNEKQQAYLLKAIEAFNRKMIVVTPEFRILATHGRDLENKKFTGHQCHRSLYGQDAPCDFCPALEVLQTGKPAMRESRDNTLNFRNISCLYAYPILSGDTIEALAIHDFELPRLQGLEEQLQRSNAFLHNLINSAVDGVMAADRTGRIIIFNEAAAEISGHSIEAVLTSMNISEVYPDDVAREVMQKLRSEDWGGRGKLKNYPVNVVGKNGECIPISLNAAIIYEGDKEVATIGFFHDMRKQIQIQKELEKTQIQLLQSAKMASLGKLAAGVAHQLNNPLGSITLYAKLVMEEYDLCDEAHEDILRILKDAQRCRDTVRELLEFSRQTRQFMKPNDINRAIERTLFLLENQTLFHNIEIEKDLAVDLPMVHADIQQLNHMFMNLILNAAQAMEKKGRLRIATRWIQDADRAIIEITDTGPGISKETLEHIFEPFFTTKEEGKGTGLGLSIVYGIVENHKGKISADSRTGEGTTFSIELPVNG
ncbi:MAG: PAS domain S-box protein [Desulfobacterales bacterium]|nr:PAS domain S-box protein [Desulfobacterales bacterium]